MENSKINLIRSELDMAASYLDRLFHGLIDLSDLDYHPELKRIIEPFYKELLEYLNQDLFNHQLKNRFEETPLSAVLFREWIVDVFKSLESFTRLGIKENAIEAYIKIINCGYRLGRELHLFCLRETDLLVELPRILSAKEFIENRPISNLIIPKPEVSGLEDFLNIKSEAEFQEDEHEDWDELSLPLYQINLSNIEMSEFGGSILSYSMGVLKKSKELINKGHECIFEKKYSNALVFFERSRRLNENAEILTLIGWVYSLLENLNRGKKFCLKAIELDPDYGPAYNDIGSYLLEEGDINESIRWFNLAKNAPLYHNKEYPYINTGRAFLMQKKYVQALEEFKMAHKIAPHQKKISETISKVQNLMAPKDENIEEFDDFPFLKNNLTTISEFESELQ